MGKIFDAIDKQLIRPKVMASHDEGVQITEENMHDFYSVGAPVQYERTGQYGDSTSSDGVSGGSGNYHYRIYLEDPAYNTGSYDGNTVLSEAEIGGSGILGKSGRWQKSVDDNQDIINKNFK